MSKIIYHITSKTQWQQALQNGYYTHSSLPKEGFIHCSEAHQVQGVLERYYKNETNLIKLCIDVDRLTQKLIYELAPSVNQQFPHVYGTINIDAVIDIVEV